MSQSPWESDLAELRTQMMRVRAQTHDLTDSFNALRDELRPQVEEARREREDSEREFLAAYRNGELDDERRALAQRIDRGETTWAEVIHGQDEHWSAQQLRTSVSEGLESVMEELREQLPELDEQLSALRESAERQRDAGST